MCFLRGDRVLVGFVPIECSFELGYGHRFIYLRMGNRLRCRLVQGAEKGGRAIRGKIGVYRQVESITLLTDVIPKERALFISFVRKPTRVHVVRHRMSRRQSLFDL